MRSGKRNQVEERRADSLEKNSRQDKAESFPSTIPFFDPVDCRRIEGL